MIRFAAFATVAALAATGPALAQEDDGDGALRCPAADCPGELVVNPGPFTDPATGRKFFLDYPKDLKPGEDVTLVLNLHGGGSYGNWQRHYFPIVDLVDEKRLVVITPNAPPRRWTEVDDAHLQNIVEMAEARFGKENIRAFWLAGHSQGGMTSRRIVCSDFFQPRVTGLLSLSGGRLGGQAPRAPDAGRPTQRGAQPSTGSIPIGAIPQPAEPACDFSHIFAIGEYEIASLPETSAIAQKFGCKARVRRPDVADSVAGYVYDSSHQDPASKSWGRTPKGGTAQVWVYPDCEDGRVVVDVVRVDKGHTEGLEPEVTRAIVDLMLAAK